MGVELFDIAIVGVKECLNSAEMDIGGGGWK